MVGRAADSSPKVPDPRRRSVSLSLPPPLATTEATLEGGGVAAIRRYGNPDGPRLLMSHGNGLAIELYYPYWSLLLDDFDLMLFDLRNHGANALGTAAHHTVPAFCRDVEAVGRAVDREYGARPRAGVYHSASSLAALLSPSVGVSYAALVLFDPPLFPPGAPRRAFEAACRQAAQRTRIRAFRFRSEAEFAELMSAQPAFDRSVPGAARRMARTTLRRAPHGGFELRCPREYEANIMASLAGFARMVDLDSVALPIKVVGADPALKHYFLPPCDLSHARSVDYEVLRGTTHLAQLEKPAECAALTVDFLRKHGFTRR